MTNAASTDTTPPGRHQARDAASAEPPRTPAMQQFARFRRQYPDCILFFRMGDFYEMFDEDAHTVHRVLGLTLTRRSTGTPMAGVPYHAAEGYLAKLLAAGFRVALCDQIQDPREAKGVVDRAVTRVLTPGTLVDDSLLDESSSNHLASIVFTESGASSAAVLAVAELSTGSFVLRDLDAGSVIDELARLRPTEVLYADTADGIVPPRIDAIRESLGCMITARPAWTFRRDDAHQTLLEQYGVATLAGFGLNDDDPAIAPAAAMIRYLRETQMPDADDDAGAAARRLRHLRPPRRDPGSRYVTIDRTTLRTLEIERTMRSGAVDGSLFSALQRCRTAMGKRLLREWLCFPLRHRDDIEARHAAVATLHGDDDLDRALHGRLGEIQDVARIVGRLAIRRASPRDLAALGRSVDTIDTLIELIDARVSLARWTTELTTLREQLGPLACDIITRCVDDPPAHARDGGIFRDGIDAELDGARMLQTDAGEWLSNYQHELMTTTGISSLKVGFNKVFGYYIEITHTHTDKVPETFTRKQTLKNAERYITPELKSFEDRITTAETRAIDRERALFEALCDEAVWRAHRRTRRAAMLRRRGPAASVRPSDARGRAGARHRAGPSSRPRPDAHRSIRAQRLRTRRRDRHNGADHRTEHGRQEHLHPAGGTDHAARANRFSRPR